MSNEAGFDEAPKYDAVTALSVFLFLLLAIPSELIVGPLGSAGTPAEILGMCMLGGWLALAFGGSSSGVTRIRQPVRWMMLAFAVTVVLAYIAANLRPMLKNEMTQADAGLLLLASWLGLLLVPMDRIRSRERLDTLFRRLVFGAAAVAVVGLAQFATKQPLTNYIQIPGLRVNGTLVGIYGRDGFFRPAGTAVHPIEFGAMLTMSLPFALHYAFQDAGQRSVIRRWFPVFAIAFAIPISISRSALLSTAVVMCVLLPTWAPRVRRVAVFCMVVIAGALYVVVPGILGTISGLFLGISQDSSARSRTNSFALAFEFFHRSPLFGRGLLTYLPAYRINDDQYLGLLVEIGLVGLIAFVGLLLTGVFSAFRLRRRVERPADKSLALSLAAALASATASLATFDGFSFPMAASLIFLLLGCGAALKRLCSDESAVDLQPASASTISAH